MHRTLRALLICALSTNALLHARPRRALPRRTVSMKWGEHIDQVKGDNTFLRNKDGRPAQLQRDYGKLIITLATTGNINTRENNKDLPCSPQEMADQMHECIKLGVSILHIHSRNELLKPTMRVDKFRETCRLVKERDPDVIIQISTGGRAPPTAFEGVDVGDWRMDPLNLLPEMGSYTPGSVNLGPIVYQNDAKLTRDMAQKYKDLKIKPQVEVFDTNMISNAYNLVKAGLLEKPLEFGFVMGAPNAQECTLRQLGHLLSMLEPGDTWTSVGVGKFEMPLAYAAIAHGGHVRVGLEDTNKLPNGEIATNYELVEHVVEMAKAMGREIATPAEAREILQMDPGHIDRINAQLDPSVDLSSLVSNMAPYEGLEAIPGSLEMKPTPGHPDYPSA
jgi:3-keto-5-aminohexanoate cleavage enzyme